MHKETGSHSSDCTFPRPGCPRRGNHLPLVLRGWMRERWWGELADDRETTVRVWSRGKRGRGMGGERKKGCYSTVGELWSTASGTAWQPSMRAKTTRASRSNKTRSTENHTPEREETRAREGTRPKEGNGEPEQRVVRSCSAEAQGGRNVLTAAAVYQEGGAERGGHQLRSGGTQGM